MFEVGKKVICIESHKDGIVKKGQVFELQGIKKGTCSHHPIALDVGIEARYNKIECTICHSTINSNGTSWLCSKRFAPYDDSLSSTTVEELLGELEVVK